jgi:hypothetical protein
MQVFGLQRPHEWPHYDLSGSHFIQRVLQREEAAMKSLICYAWGDETRTKGCIPCRLLSAPCVILQGYFEDFCSHCLDTGEQCNGWSMEQQMEDSEERWVDDSDGRETTWDTKLGEENVLAPEFQKANCPQRNAVLMEHVIYDV